MIKLPLHLKIHFAVACTGIHTICNTVMKMKLCQTLFLLNGIDGVLVQISLEGTHGADRVCVV